MLDKDVGSQSPQEMTIRQMSLPHYFDVRHSEKKLFGTQGGSHQKSLNASVLVESVWNPHLVILIKSR